MPITLTPNVRASILESVTPGDNLQGALAKWRESKNPVYPSEYGGFKVTPINFTTMFPGVNEAAVVLPNGQGIIYDPTRTKQLSRAEQEELLHHAAVVAAHPTWPEFDTAYRTMLDIGNYKAPEETGVLDANGRRLGDPNYSYGKIPSSVGAEVQSSDSINFDY